MEDWWNDTDKGKREAIEEKKIVPLLVCPPKVAHGLAWD
jgi:hypothetical protein